MKPEFAMMIVTSIHDLAGNQITGVCGSKSRVTDIASSGFDLKAPVINVNTKSDGLELR